MRSGDSPEHWPGEDSFLCLLLAGPAGIVGEPQEPVSRLGRRCALYFTQARDCVYPYVLVLMP
jgi:hypothetical protein